MGRVLVDCATKEVQRHVLQAHPQTPPVQSHPGYITLPTDLVDATVSTTPLQTLLDFTVPENDAATEAVVLA